MRIGRGVVAHYWGQSKNLKGCAMLTVARPKICLAILLGFYSDLYECFQLENLPVLHVTTFAVLAYRFKGFF